MAMYIAERAAEEVGVLLLPPIWYGYTYVLDKFPGTISISQETLYRLYKDVFLEAARNGVKYLVVVNGHGGNVDLLRTARSGGRQDDESRRRVDKLVGGPSQRG
jgi:creatinine amidohydrolase